MNLPQDALAEATEDPSPVGPMRVQLGTAERAACGEHANPLAATGADVRPLGSHRHFSEAVLHKVQMSEGRLDSRCVHPAAVQSMNGTLTRVRRLTLERLEAESAGLDRNAGYMADLAEEVAACRVAFVAAAVTEIAMLRAELFGPQLG
jgi:hypothetical protein